MGFVWADMGWEIRRGEGHLVPIRDPRAGQGHAGTMRDSSSFPRHCPSKSCPVLGPQLLPPQSQQLVCNPFPVFGCYPGSADFKETWWGGPAENATQLS